jgi:isocitrate dehydrogenase kinase/phosphatase
VAKTDSSALDIDPTDQHHASGSSAHSYAVWGNLPRILPEDSSTDLRVLRGALRAAGPWAAMRIADRRCRAASPAWGEAAVRAVELLETVFYRERRAYPVGPRVRCRAGSRRWSSRSCHDADGDPRRRRCWLERENVAQIFGYTRSYLHADLATVGDAIVFLHTLLPNKPVDEIIPCSAAPSRARPSATGTSSATSAPIPTSSSCMPTACAAWSCSCSRLPRPIPLVFKLIRDRFAFPKDAVREGSHGEVPPRVPPRPRRPPDRRAGIPLPAFSALALFSKRWLDELARRVP